MKLSNNDSTEFEASTMFVVEIMGFGNFYELNTDYWKILEVNPRII
jgi:hypothetical protein